MFNTCIGTFTGQEVYVARGLRDCKSQRALMQFFKPENDFVVREALLKAGRQDLIGDGCDCMIPAHPAKGEPAGERGLPNQGYRPERKTARRQDRKRQRKGGAR